MRIGSDGSGSDVVVGVVVCSQELLRPVGLLVDSLSSALLGSFEGCLFSFSHELLETLDLHCGYGE